LNSHGATALSPGESRTITHRISGSTTTPVPGCPACSLETISGIDSAMATPPAIVETAARSRSDRNSTRSAASRELCAATADASIDGTSAP
jgi:hypothetical protein